MELPPRDLAALAQGSHAVGGRADPMRPEEEEERGCSQMPQALTPGSALRNPRPAGEEPR